MKRFKFNVGSSFRLCAVRIMVAVMCCSVVATAAAESDAPAPATNKAIALSDTRESERAYGISLRPPIGTTVLRQTADQYLMRIGDDEKRYGILVRVSQSKKAVTLTQASEAAQMQMEQIRGQVVLLGDKATELAERPARLLYFQVPDPKGSSLFGQAIIQIAGNAFAILEVECDMTQAEVVRPTFEAVLATLEIEDTDKIEARREAATQLTRDFQSKLRTPMIHEALIPDQLFRVVDFSDPNQPRDVGYMRMQQAVVVDKGLAGIGIDVQSRLVVQGFYYDTVSHYFLSDDDTFEAWSNRTTRREPVGSAKSKSGSPKDADTTLETGVRTRSKIDVTVDGPGGAKRFSLTRPTFAYMSQLESMLMPQILPADQPATYGFYCYSSQYQKITYRTEQVIPTFDGYTVITRLAPNEEPLTAQYGSDHRLIEKQLSSTLKRIPTTPEMLKKLWPEK